MKVGNFDSGFVVSLDSLCPGTKTRKRKAETVGALIPREDLRDSLVIPRSAQHDLTAKGILIVRSLRPRSVRDYANYILESEVGGGAAFYCNHNSSKKKKIKWAYIAQSPRINLCR